MTDKLRRSKMFMQDQAYKFWLEDQVSDDTVITVECVHCGEEIELQDGGFMSWNYSPISHHLAECESAIEEFEKHPQEKLKKPNGFDDDGRNYPRAKYCGTE